MSDVPRLPEPRDLARWSSALAAIARTGMGFTENLYERERYEEVLHVAADIKAAAAAMEEIAAVERETDHFVQEWLDNIDAVVKRHQAAQTTQATGTGGGSGGSGVAA